MSVYVCACVSMCVCVCACVRIYVYMCACVCVCVCLCAYIRIYIYVCVCVCARVCVYVCVCVLGSYYLCGQNHKTCGHGKRSPVHAHQHTNEIDTHAITYARSPDAYTLDKFSHKSTHANLYDVYTYHMHSCKKLQWKYMACVCVHGY
jgi:hypothetical protein